jgi:HD-GYP domain-containing protein (c-di-GMP phosphodiesterase class II)
MILDQLKTDAAASVLRSSIAIARVDSAAVAERLQHLSRLIALPLAAYDLDSRAVVAETELDLLPTPPPELLLQCRDALEPKVLVTASGISYFGIPLRIANHPGLVAVGAVLSYPGVRPVDLIVAAANRGWSTAEFDRWLARQRACDPQMLHRLVTLAAQDVDRLDAAGHTGSDYARIAEQLDYTYEELNVLHTLTQSMYISRSPREVAELALQRIEAVILAEGHAIWLDDKRDGRLFLIQGSIPFDEMGMARLIARFDGHDWPRPLVRNHVAGTLLGGEFPRIRNFALSVIAGGGLRFGWILSCNLQNGQDFGSIQTSLLSSVGSILGTYQHNLELYRQHEDLLLCFVRSLISTLDAKDPYTRGHSERVALIARRLGAELQLPREDLKDIYLSGLLHDIGKIGVDDQILRKPGALTRDEFEQVKRHPVIGYNILAGLRNLRAVLPGVRHHHEAFNGAGYPDGLAGDEIPLMARILAVADSYDAMISNRPYRDGLRLGKLESILRDGAGRQWDARVVDAYFRGAADIQKICEEYSSERVSGPADNSPEAGRLIEEHDPVARVEAIRTALDTIAKL